MPRLPFTLQFVSPAAVPPALAGWLPGDALATPRPPGRLQPGAAPVCWLVDGADPAFCAAALATLRQFGTAEDHPWVMWLADPALRPLRSADAWAWGAQDILDAGELATLPARLDVLHARLNGPEGLAHQLHRLRRQLQALQASVDNIPAPIFVKDAEGRYTHCNRAFLDYIGRAREQVIGRTVYDIAPPELAQVYDAADQALLASGAQQVYEAKVRWADQSMRDVTFFKAVFHDETQRPAGQAGAIFDITDRRRLEQGLRELAETDVLTGLPNRRSFFERGEPLLMQAALQGRDVLVMMIDIDHFKLVNDGHGHAAGDALLRHVADQLRTHLRAGDLVARLGGDEFAVLLVSPAAADGQAAVDLDSHGRQLVERLPQVIAATPVHAEGRRMRACISLGAALLPANGHSLDGALSVADRALYEAKRLGRNRASLIDPRGASGSGRLQEPQPRTDDHSPR